MTTTEVEMGRRFTRKRRAVAVALALATLGILAAGCGGKGSPNAGVASLGGTTTTSSSNDSGSAGSGGGTSSGGGGGSSSFGVNMSVNGASRRQVIAFAQCMRTHGVPNFPDPSSDGSFHFNGSPKDQPKFLSASQKCHKLLPAGKPPSPAQQQKMKEAGLKFSACMRSHGFPSFPDPTFSNGGMQLRLNKGAGMDPNSPRFQSAQRACQSFMPGKFAGK
jgi:hypothetical protein